LLTVRLTREAGVPVLHVRGELDMATIHRLEHRVEHVAEAYGPYLVLDLSGVPFCDAAGVGGLLRVARALRRVSGELRLAAVNPPVWRVFGVVRLPTVIPCHEHVPAAVRAVLAARAPTT
jgi:anti-sigma B factor antagonist